MTLLFASDFAPGDFSEFDSVQQFVPGRAKVVSGSRASLGGPTAAREGVNYFESEVHNGDNVLGGERCEILKGGFDQGVPGTDLWTAWSVWMPSSLPIGLGTGLEGQFHSDYNFAQANQFFVNPSFAGSFFGATRAAPRWLYGVSGGPAMPGSQEQNGTYSKCFDCGLLATWLGAGWVDVMAHYVWQDDLTGTVELWLKLAAATAWAKYVDRRGNIANAFTGNADYLKLGQNRAESSGLAPGFMWYSRVRIGDTQLDVDVLAGGGGTGGTGGGTGGTGGSGPPPTSVGTFPPTTVLDPFDRNGEVPLSFGGRWREYVNPLNAHLRINNSLDIVEVSSPLDLGGSGSPAGALWIADGEMTDSDMALGVEALSPGTIVLLARAQTPSGHWTARDGYEVALTDNDVKIYVVVAGTRTELADFPTSALVANIGMAVRGTTIDAWLQLSGGSWELVASATDSTFTTGYPGFWLRLAQPAVAAASGGLRNIPKLWVADFHGRDPA